MRARNWSNRASAAMLAAVVMGGYGAAVFGTTVLGPDGAEVAADLNSPAALLGPEYKDEANGFRVNTPAGVTLVDRRAVDPGSLLNFVHEGKGYAGFVQAVHLTNALDPDAYLKAAIASLQATDHFKGLQVLEQKQVTIGSTEGVSGKPAARFVVTYVSEPLASKGRGPAVKVASENIIRQDVAVQTGPKDYMLLSMTAPQAKKDEAIKVFDAMVSTYEVWNRSEAFERRKATVKAGIDWIGKQTPESLLPKLNTTPLYYRIQIEGKDLGYMRFDEKETTNLKFHGIMVTVVSRSFPNETGVVLGANTAFWACQKQPDRAKQTVRFSMWSNAVKSIIFTTGGPQAAWSTETGALTWERPEEVDRFPAHVPTTAPTVTEKEDGIYVISVARSADKKNTILNERGEVTPILGGDVGFDRAVRFPMKPPRPEDIFPESFRNLPPEVLASLPPPPAPMPKVVEYTWPRMVDLKQKTRMAMTTFNTNTNKLGLRTLSVLGPEPVTLDGKTVPAIKLLDELAPGSTTMWVDNNGKILTMRTSDKTVLTLTTEEQMYRLWKPRLQRLPAKPTAAGAPPRTVAEELFSDY